MTAERDLGPRLTYLLERALVALEDLHAEHLEPIEVSGREYTIPSRGRR
ncbi:hypothetical protein [Amycolatopsis sp. cmx-4-68]